MRLLPLVTAPLLFLLLPACNAEQDSSLSRAIGACGETETHVIGVYDGGSDPGVVIARPGKHALVLSAHAAATWHVTVEPGAELVHVYAVGYHHQAVDAPPGTDILTESHDDGTADATGYAYPDEHTKSLLALAAERVHHKPTAFHGCHTAQQWTIAENMLVTSDCDEQAGYTQVDAILDCDPQGGSACGSGSSGSGGSGSSGSGSSSDPIF